MKVKLIEEIKIDIDLDCLSVSRFDKNKLLISDQAEKGLYIFKYDLNTKEKLYKYFDSSASYSYILDDFSIFIDDDEYIDDKHYKKNIILNTETFETKILGTQDQQLCKTGNENYFEFRNELEKYTLDVKNDKVINFVFPKNSKYKEKYNDIEKEFYTKNNEKVYTKENGREIFLINDKDEIKYYSYSEFYFYPLAITINNKVIIAGGEILTQIPEKYTSQYNEKEDKLANIIIWDKETSKIIYTYKGRLSKSSHVSPDNMYYFEKFNCLILQNEWEVLILDLSKKEIIFESGQYSLYVDEENNRFGVYSNDSEKKFPLYDSKLSSYKIFELVEE
ncbi:MAG: hypothetical protein AABZ74_13185 [Cyanobacteriota bacterium]